MTFCASIGKADSKKILLFNNFQKLSSFLAKDGDVAYVKIKNRKGFFVYDKQRKTENDHGTVFNGWVRVYDGPINIKWFGAYGDGKHDDTLAFEYAKNSDKMIYVPPGKYIVKKTFNKLDLVGKGEIVYRGKQVGKFIYAGINNGNNNNSLYGGLVIGGEDDHQGLLYRAGANNAWGRIEPTYNGAEVQLQLYTGAFVRKAVAVKGTPYIVATYGNFENQNIRKGDLVFFGGEEYRIKSKISKTKMELERKNHKKIVFKKKLEATFMHCYQYALGTCNIAGDKVHRTSGDIFLSLANSDDAYIEINKKKYRIKYRKNTSSLVLKRKIGNMKNVDFKLKINRKSKLVNIFRLQTLKGGSEENFMIGIDQRAQVRLETQFAGKGEYMPIKLRTGKAKDFIGSRDALTITKEGNIQINKTIKNINAKLEINQRTPKDTRSSIPPIAQFSYQNKDRRKKWLEIASNETRNGLWFQAKNEEGVTALSVNPKGGKIFFGTYEELIDLNYSFNGDLGPAVDSLYNLGTVNHKFKKVFVSQGYITAIDENIQKEPSGITKKEKRIATELKGLIKKYRLKKSKKFTFGINVYKIKKIFQRYGLNIDNYALFEKCSDGNKNCGINYDQLLLFIMSSM